MITELEFRSLLQKYQNGQCTEAELALIDSYIERSSKSETQEPDAKLIKKTFERISHAIEIHEQQSSKRHNVFIATLRLAATLLLFISAGWVLYQSRSSIRDLIEPVSYRNITTAKGRKVTVNLPDGSVVILNQESKLTYSNRFNEQLREVSLYGEAFFKVKKDKARPFIVHSGKLTTKVLGTSFNIEAYPFSNKIAVALITGKIWIQAKSSSRKDVNIILNPNQALSYDILSGETEKQNVSNAENFIAWKDGKIKFFNTRLEEAVRRLNVTFRSKIEIFDPYLKSQRIYGEFGSDDSVTEVVNNLCLLTKAKCMTKPGGKIIIYPFKYKKED